MQSPDLDGLSWFENHEMVLQCISGCLTSSLITMSDVPIVNTTQDTRRTRAQMLLVYLRRCVEIAVTKRSFWAFAIPLYLQSLPPISTLSTIKDPTTDMNQMIYLWSINDNSDADSAPKPRKSLINQSQRRYFPNWSHVWLIGQQKLMCSQSLDAISDLPEASKVLSMVERSLCMNKTSQVYQKTLVIDFTLWVRAWVTAKEK